jgi:glycerol transport system permease protein
MKKRPWLFLLPVLILVSINAFIPLMTVANYSQLYLFAGSAPVFSGLENYVQVLTDPLFHGALGRQIILSLLILMIQIPLGIFLAMKMPTKGPGLAVTLVLLGIPLLIPTTVVACIWRLITQADVGILPKILAFFHYSYDAALNPFDAFTTILMVDVWHWTPLVILLCYAGLMAIPKQYYAAADIDGASKWATFRYVTLPKLRPVLVIAVLLRFMDSFSIYTEPMIMTGGGPGNTTTFLNLFVARKAETYELGYAGAVSLIYLLIVVTICFVFFKIIMNVGEGEAK